MPEPDIKQIM